MTFSDPAFASNYAGLLRVIGGIDPDEQQFPDIPVNGRVELRVVDLNPLKYFDDRQMRPELAPMYRGRLTLMSLAHKGDVVYGIGRPRGRAGGIMIGMRFGAATLNAAACALDRPDLAGF